MITSSKFFNKSLFKIEEEDRTEQLSSGIGPWIQVRKDHDSLKKRFKTEITQRTQLPKPQRITIDKKRLKRKLSQMNHPYISTVNKPVKSCSKELSPVRLRKYMMFREKTDTDLHHLEAKIRKIPIFRQYKQKTERNRIYNYIQSLKTGESMIKERYMRKNILIANPK